MYIMRWSQLFTILSSFKVITILFCILHSVYYTPIIYFITEYIGLLREGLLITFSSFADKIC